MTARPGHRSPPVADAESRLRLAEAAFADLPAEVVLDEHPFTADAVRGGRFGEALFLLGADEGAAFRTWKQPEEVLRWVKLAVGTRSGYPPPDLGPYGDRVVSFELDSPDISSSDVRERIGRGDAIDSLVPPAVAETIAGLGLYRGYTDPDPERT